MVVAHGVFLEISLMGMVAAGVLADSRIN